MAIKWNYLPRMLAGQSASPVYGFGGLNRGSSSTFPACPDTGGLMRKWRVLYAWNRTLFDVILLDREIRAESILLIDYYLFWYHNDWSLINPSRHWLGLILFLRNRNIGEGESLLTKTKILRFIFMKLNASSKGLLLNVSEDMGLGSSKLWWSW